MKIQSFLYGLIVHIAIFFFVVFGMFAAMAAAVLPAFLFDWLPDAFFMFFGVFLMLFLYAFGWFWAAKFAFDQKLRWIDFQIGSLVPLVLMVALFFIDGASVADIVYDWDDAGCGFVPPAFVFLCSFYAFVLLPVYQYKLRHQVFADGADMKRKLYRVWGDLVLLLLLLIGITLLFVDR
ncbi:hypothetical protein [Bacillus atrophaeus]|uniref:hypothetical protein n=1 Tax=Bacillus atrophaeus TaxID=1452 RepID=UPI0022808132|nr:hypothetical protein [Bacillus atrophaeus]MCY8516809.1 hypothetical protein [Bacillus atrophaeus]MCY9111432.1 hypothetical protein [Bacillus atrophaeus]